MTFVAAGAFVMYQKVHLLLDEIAVVATEGDEKCLGGLRMYRTLFHFSELHNSHFLHGSNCVVLINCVMKKQTRVKDQKLKINLEWPKCCDVLWEETTFSYFGATFTSESAILMLFYIDC